MKTIIVSIMLLCWCGCNENEKKEVLNLGGTDGAPAFGALSIDTAYTDSSGVKWVRLREKQDGYQDSSIDWHGLPQWEQDRAQIFMEESNKHDEGF